MDAAPATTAAALADGSADAGPHSARVLAHGLDTLVVSMQVHWQGEGLLQRLSEAFCRTRGRQVDDLPYAFAVYISTGLSQGIIRRSSLPTCSTPWALSFSRCS